MLAVARFEERESFLPLPESGALQGWMIWETDVLRLLPEFVWAAICEAV
jgi:hypothetical protein